MKRHWTFPMVLVAGLLLSSCQNIDRSISSERGTQKLPNQPPAPPVGLVEQIPSWLAATGIPAVGIALVEDGEVVWAHTSGQRADGVPADPRTLFNVASLTKPVFAMMVLHQVARGEVGLDQPIVEFFTAKDFADDPRQALLTPRLVLSHQTGLPNWRWERELKFLADPGQRFSYSGEAYEYLSRAMHHKLSAGAPDLMRAGVLGRAGMNDTFLGWNEEVESRYAFGVDGRTNPDPVEPWLRDGSSQFAAAGMVSTVEDYAKFLAWVVGGAEMPRELLHDMATAQVLIGPQIGWGLGWVILDLGEDTVLCHSGGEEGVAAFTALSLTEQRGVVVFTSASFGDPLIHEIIHRLLARGRDITARLGLYEMYSLNAYWQRIRVEELAREEREEHYFGIGENPNKLPVLVLATKTFAIERSGLSADEMQKAHRILDSLMYRLSTGALDPAQIDALSARIATRHPMGGFWYVRTDLADGELRNFIEYAEQLL